MKTAISVPDDIFLKVEALSKELHLSRSRIFTEAVRDFVGRRKNEETFQALNRAYTSETEEEVDARKQARRAHAKLRKTEQW